jgi:hypothetical protein
LKIEEFTWKVQEEISLGSSAATENIKKILQGMFDSPTPGFEDGFHKARRSTSQSSTRVIEVQKNH